MSPRHLLKKSDQVAASAISPSLRLLNRAFRRVLQLIIGLDQRKIFNDLRPEPGLGRSFFLFFGSAAAFGFDRRHGLLLFLFRNLRRGQALGATGLDVRVDGVGLV